MNSPPKINLIKNRKKIFLTVVVYRNRQKYLFVRVPAMTNHFSILPKLKCTDTKKQQTTYIKLMTFY